MRVSDHYTPFPRQQQFHESPAKYRLFGGAAGPGKTKALLWEAIRQANRYPGVDTLLLRRSFPELEASLLREFRRNVPRDLYRSFNDSKHTVRWWNGSTTQFGHCRTENDVFQYQGGEYIFIGIDELTHFTLKMWQFLTSRNRCPAKAKDARILPSMAGASNPGNIGHAWVKALWMDKRLDPACATKDYDPSLGQYDPSEYEFIPAKLTDNPVYANDVEYHKTLSQLPEILRRAMLEGDWTIFAGQYFDIFREGRHTERAERLPRKEWWKCWISVDWGFQHPSAVYWHTLTPERRVITFREWVQPGLSPRMLAQGLAERTKEPVENIYLSPDAFAQRTAEASIAEQLADVLASLGLPRPAAATDDRIGGWQFMYQLLESDRWVIAENCDRLIKCLPTLVRDEKKVEDIAKMDGDDPADAARYGLYGVPGIEPGKMPLGERVQEKMKATEMVDKETGAIVNMTSYAIHAQKIEAEERRKYRPVRLGRRRH